MRSLVHSLMLGLLVVACLCMGICDWLLLRRVKDSQHREGVGVAPFRWFRPELYEQGSEGVRRLAILSEGFVCILAAASIVFEWLLD